MPGQSRFPQAALHQFINLPERGPSVRVAVIGGPAGELAVDRVYQVLLRAIVGEYQLLQTGLDPGYRRL